MTAESSLGFCYCCNERKENDQLIMTQKCGNFVCFDCSLLKQRKCPLPSCDPAPKSGAFKEFLPQDLSFLWRKTSSVDPIPNLNFSSGFRARMDSRRTKQIIPRWKPKEATASSVPKIIYRTKEDKGPEQVLSPVKNRLPQLLASTQLLKEFLDSDSDSDSSSDSDDYDSDASPRSPESCRKSKWFEKFDRKLELCVGEGEMNGVGRKWNCPVCPGYARAFRSYRSLESLIRHAKRKHSTRERLHLELSHLIEYRLKHKAVASKWRGLKEDKGDHEIVWPPMVVVSYSLHKTDENSVRIGVANQELMEMFSSYDGITKVQRCHHLEPFCGMSILVFESSVLGYLEAERLHKGFVDEKTDRNAWNSQSVHFLSDGEKQLYGYLALKEDVDSFNNHIQDTEKLEYEMRSYQEMVASQIKQIPIKNCQVVLLRKRVKEHEKQAKEYEESCSLLKEKLRLAKEESNIMRRRAREQHKEHTEEIECQEQFYKEKIRNILGSRNGKTMVRWQPLSKVL